MPVIDPAHAPDVITMEGFEGRYANSDGWTVGFERYDNDDAPAPPFKGLPDDACQCIHLGYVIEGAVTFNYTDGRSETIAAGQAYYAGPGHLPVFHAGGKVVEFSPTAELEQTVAVVMGNLAAMGMA